VLAAAAVITAAYVSETLDYMVQEPRRPLFSLFIVQRQ
jgi:hypothetical protein